VKAKIICILVMMLLITNTLPVVGKMTNNDGLIDTGKNITTNPPELLKPTQSLRATNIALINDNLYAPDVKTQLELLGKTVTLINIPDITAALLSGYDAVWIPAECAKDIDDAGKATEIKNYVFAGGGLIFTQPNVIGFYVPQCLPYTWEIIDKSYENGCAGKIIDPNHPLTQGLTINDMPDCYETMGTIGTQYTILVVSDDGEPGLACAKYGDGKIIVIMDAPFTGGMDVCGDSPSLSQNFVTQMLGWVDKAKSVNLPKDIVSNRPLIQFLQSHPNLFPFLQKLIQSLGLQ